MKVVFFILISISIVLTYVIYNDDKSIVIIDHKNSQNLVESKVELQELSELNKKTFEVSNEEKNILRVNEINKENETSLHLSETLEKNESDPYSHISSKRIKELWVNDSGEEPSYKGKWKSIKKIGLNLTKEEKSDIYDFIRNGPNKDVHDLHLKDELMIKLEKQPDISNEYLNEFIDIASDKSIDGALRGYVMQHIRSAYWNHIEKRDDLRSSIYNGLEDHSSDVSGTALMAAVSLNERFGGFDDEKINKAAIKLSHNPLAHLPSKMTAIKIIGEQKLEEGLDLVRDKAQNGEDTVMKIVAIHSLGDIGTKEDLEFMNKMLKNEALEVMHPALKKSIYKVENRL